MNKAVHQGAWRITNRVMSFPPVDGNFLVSGTHYITRKHTRAGGGGVELSVKYLLSAVLLNGKLPCQLSHVGYLLKV